MAGWQHGHEGLAEHRPEAELRLVGGRFARQADVDGLVVECGELWRGGHLVDVQVHAGELVPEVAQQVGQDGQREGGREADPEAAGLTAADRKGRGQAVGETG